jgi:hypothetical protein
VSTLAFHNGFTNPVAPGNGLSRCAPATGVAVGVEVGPTGVAVLVGVEVGAGGVGVAVLVAPTTGVDVRVAVLVVPVTGVGVRVGVLVATASVGVLVTARTGVGVAVAVPTPPRVSVAGTWPRALF